MKNLISNEELVALAQGGDTLALAMLTERFVGINRARFPAGYLEIEDLNQEGMLGFLAAVRTYKPNKGASFSTYASTCIKNRIINAAKKAGNAEEPTQDEFLEQTDGSTPFDAVLGAENLQGLLEFFSTHLSKKEYAVIDMYISGFTCHDIAGSLGVSEKSVDNSLQRAKRKLREYCGGLQE